MIPLRSLGSDATTGKSCWFRHDLCTDEQVPWFGPKPTGSYESDLASSLLLEGDDVLKRTSRSYKHRIAYQATKLFEDIAEVRLEEV